MRYLLTVLVTLWAGLAHAEINSFTIINPMTGEVSTGNVVTQPDGSQSYLWTNPYTGETTSGFVGSPQGGMSNFSTTNTTTGEVEIGTITTFPANDEPVRLPQPPQGGTIAPGRSR